MYMTSLEFNQDLARAKQESLSHPVVITDKGEPKHVLMNFAEFEQIMQLAEPKSKSKFKPKKTLFDYFVENNYEVVEHTDKNALDIFMRLEHDNVADIELEIPPRSTAERPPVDFGL